MRTKGMKGRPMRWVFWSLIVLGLTSPAVADDFGILRGAETVGPATYTRWSGFYFGGQVGYGNANANFSGATDALIAFVLRNTTLENQIAPSHWPVLGAADSRNVGFGGFAGYNTQWQDLILGAELNYNHAAFSLHAPASPISRITSDSTGTIYSINFTGNGSMTAEDFATLRLRAGWVAGNFLPYAFIGPAVGVGSSSVSVNGSGVQCPKGTVGVCSLSQPGSIPFSINNSLNANSQVLYGFTVGGGVDVALMQNIFLRAEVEFDQFQPPPGFFMTVVTGRVGAGVRF